MKSEKQLLAMDGQDNLAVTSEEGKILSDLIKKNRPKKILEVGTGNGYSTCWIIWGMGDKTSLYTVDHVKRYLLFNPDERIVFLKGELKENFSSLPENLDFVFLDSDHTIDKITKDIETIEPKLTKDSMVVVHDTQFCPEMGHVLKDYFNGVDSERLNHCGVKASRSKWIYEEIKTKFGLGIAKRGEK